MKRLFATLAALAAFTAGAIAQNPDTPPAAADSTVTVAAPELPDAAEAAVADTTAALELEVADLLVPRPVVDSTALVKKCCRPDNYLANHLSIGLALGWDGVGAQIALPLGHHFDIRAGYTYFPSFEKTPRQMAEGSFGSVIPSEEDLSFETSTDGREINLYDVPIGLIINNFGPNVLVDYFPWKDMSFHLTAGAFFNKGEFLTLTADVSGQLQPGEAASLGISFKNIEDVTTDPQGVIRFDWRANAVRPYFGLGWGRPVSKKHRVGVGFDMGLVMLGGKGLYTYSYSGRSGKEDVAITSDGLDNEDDGLVDTIAGLSVLPMMKLTLNVRLF